MSTQDLVESVDNLTKNTTEMLDVVKERKQVLEDSAASAEQAAIQTASDRQATQSNRDQSYNYYQQALGQANRAKQIAELDKVTDALRLAAVPTPDFELPLVSDLQIKHGFGKHDQIDVSAGQDGSVMVDLPTRSAQFARASKKIVTDKTGVPQEVPSDKTTMEKYGIPIEGVSTNNIPHSNTPMEWVSGPNVTVSHYGEFGIINVAKVLPTASGIKRLYSISAIDASDSGSVTLSIYAQSSSYNEIRFRFSSNSILYAAVVIDIDKEERLTGDLPFKIEYLAEGWKRIEVTYTPDSDIADRVQDIKGEIWLYTDGVSDGEPDGESFFLLGLPQFEGLPFASSPIVTGASPVTRSPDIPSFDVSQNIPVNSDKTYFMTVASNGVYLPKGTGTANSRRQIITFGATQNSEKGYHSIFVYPDASKSKNIVSVFDSLNAEILGSAPFDEECFSITYRREGNIGTLFINGVKHNAKEFENHHITEQSVTIGGLYGGRNLYGHIRNLKIWHRALTDEQVSALGGA